MITTTVKERPILFSTPMVVAVQDDRKDVTRRTIGLDAVNALVCEVKLSSTFVDIKGRLVATFRDGENDLIHCACPYGQPGDILWVRETWFPTRFDYKELRMQEYIKYAADGNYNPKKDCVGRSWKPSIHMPRWVSRTRLNVVSITVERLHDITEEDAIREGVQENICDSPEKCISSLCKDGCSGKGEYYRYPVDFDGEPCYSARESFETLWQSINGKESWEANPWVWRIEFTKIASLCQK